MVRNQKNEMRGRKRGQDFCKWAGESESRMKRNTAVASRIKVSDKEGELSRRHCQDLLAKPQVSSVDRMLMRCPIILSWCDETCTEMC